MESKTSRRLSAADQPNVSEVFQLGSIVSVETSFNDRFQGEVIAYDGTYKVLLLKSTSVLENQRKSTDVHLINLAYVSNVNIENVGGPTPRPKTLLTHVNVEKISCRKMKHLDERKKMTSAIVKGISLEGISLFFAIRRTFEEVTWQDRDIVVMNSVRIQPPYRPENCVPSSGIDSPNRQSVAHIRNIVQKHFGDQRKEQRTSNPPKHSEGGRKSRNSGRFN